MGKKSDQALVELRRMRVASLVLRKLTQREIVEVLSKYGIVNPETKKPYSLGTINHDIQMLKERWREEAGAAMEDHQSRVLAELQEVKREAWAQKEMGIILAALGKEIGLLRLNSAPIMPAQADVKLDVVGMDEGTLDKLIANLEILVYNENE